jgi:hypothetical protein
MMEVKQQSSKDRRNGSGKNRLSLDKLEATHNKNVRMKQPKNEKAKFPGAKFALQQRLMALDRNGKWKLVKVVEIRREEVNSEDEDEATKEESVMSGFPTLSTSQVATESPKKED